ncbi:ABC transporter substrate-binding protein [Streptomyces sp. NPDC029721]|uniref:ABC transporter substrate-binding protein n=1 Tax=Streptomyces sp. NPDC029721 TaxID=3157090 RepID=UPI0033C17DE0
MTTLPPLSRRGLLRAVGAGSLLMTLGACRSAVDDSTPSAAASPRRGGTLTVAHGVDFTPSLLFAVSAMTLVPRLVFNTLTRYDEKLRPQPELAKSWQVAPDGKSITFTLRDDVTFHNGRKFTADDVIFAVQNLQNPVRAAQLRSTAATVTAFEKRGDHEITLGLAHPVSNLFDLFEFMFIADKDSVEDAVAGKQLIGTGPYTFTGRNPGASLSFARNERYWQPGRPYLDKVEIRIIPQPDSLLSSLRTAQSQLSFDVRGQDVAQLKDDKQFRIKGYDTGAGALYLGANVKEQYTSDKRVRQALSWAVDRERIVKQVLGGYGQASAAPWPKSSPAYSDANATRYQHDPDKARALLKEAGHDSLSLPLAHASVPRVTAIAQIIQYDLKQIGITTELQPYDSATMQKKLIAQQMPALWTMGHGFAQVHPSTLAVSAYPFNEAKNTSQFSSPAYTEAVRAAWVRDDAEGPEALAAYQRISDQLLDEAFIIDLAVEAQVEVATAKVHGADLNKFGYLILDDAYLV